MPFMRKYNTLLVTGTTSIRIPIIKRAVVDFALGADWTPAAGDVKVFVDAAAVANITNLPTAIASGNTAQWEFIITAAELTCKQLLVMVSDAATKAIEDQSFIIETYGNASAMYAADLSLANLPANVTQLLGTAWLTPGTAGTPDVNAKLLGATAQTGRDIGASVLLSSGTGTGQLDFTSGVVKANATQILGGTIPAVTTTGVPKVDVQNWTGTAVSAPSTAGVVEANVKNIANAAVSTSSAQIGVNVVNAGGTAWASGSITNAVFSADSGKATIRSNTAQAGAATTITLDASASASNNFYNNDIVYITGGTGVGQARFITAYVGATKVATVATWTTNPDVTSTFAILPFDAVAGASAPTAAQVATAVWQDATAGDFTAASSIGKSLYTTGAVPGAAGGVFIAGTNAATTVTTALTTTFTGNLTGSVGSVATGGITAASIADAAIDRATFAADTGLTTIRSNTAQAGGATSITLDASASASNNFYNNDIVYLTGGTGIGQARFISAYDGTTKVATVSAWVTNPDVTSTFAILPFDAVAGASAPTTAQIATAVWQDATAGDFTTASSIGKSLYTTGVAPGGTNGLFIAGTNAATTVTTALTTTFTGNLTGSVASVTGAVGSVTGLTAATVHSDLDDIQARLPAALVSGRIDASVGAVAANAITAAGIADSALDALTFTATICTGTVTAASTTTSVICSVVAPVTSVNDQFKGRIMIFDRATTTVALRGQATDITAYTHATITFTVTALTTAPVSGDSFHIL